MEISPNQNKDSDSVKNSESYDIKFLTRFPGNPVLKILMKICHCVGGSNMRGCFRTKVCRIAIYNFPVILRYIFAQVYVI